MHGLLIIIKNKFSIEGFEIINYNYIEDKKFIIQNNNQIY